MHISSAFPLHLQIILNTTTINLATQSNVKSNVLIMYGQMKSEVQKPVCQRPGIDLRTICLPGRHYKNALLRMLYACYNYEHTRRYIPAYFKHSVLMPSQQTFVAEKIYLHWIYLFVNICILQHASASSVAQKRSQINF